MENKVVSTEAGLQPAFKRKEVRGAHIEWPRFSLIVLFFKEVGEHHRGGGELCKLPSVF